MLKQKAFIRHILLFDCTYSTCQMHLNVAQLWTQSGQRFKNLGSVPLSHRSHVHPVFVRFSSHSPNIQVTWIGHSLILISSQVVEAWWWFFISSMECMEDLTAYSNPPQDIHYLFYLLKCSPVQSSMSFYPQYASFYIWLYMCDVGHLNAPWTHWGHAVIQLLKTHFLKTNRRLWCK